MKRHSSDTRYEEIRTIAIEKSKSGKKLSASEDVALNERWFFSFTLPIEAIRKIISTAESIGVKPSVLVEAWVSKEVEKL